MGIAACIMGLLIGWLGFGDHGLIQLYRKEMERQAHVERIRELAQQNQRMLDEINRLRTDLKYIESVARKELNLIKPNEIVYRFSEEKTNDNTVNIPNISIQGIDQQGNSETEVKGNGKIK